VKPRIAVDGENQVLDNAAASAASIEEAMPGVFSILLGTRSFTVAVAARGHEFEAVSSDGVPRIVSVVDARDRHGSADTLSTKGPAIIRAQMPGKIIKVMVELGGGDEDAE
jgi:biotin carboxyl carrier protein